MAKLEDGLQPTDLSAWVHIEDPSCATRPVATHYLSVRASWMAVPAGSERKD